MMAGWMGTIFADSISRNAPAFGPAVVVLVRPSPGTDHGGGFAMPLEYPCNTLFFQCFTGSLVSQLTGEYVTSLLLFRAFDKGFH